MATEGCSQGGRYGGRLVGKPPSRRYAGMRINPRSRLVLATLGVVALALAVPGLSAAAKNTIKVETTS